MDGSVLQAQVATRVAVPADVPAIVAGIGELLREIGGKPAAEELLRVAARELIEDPQAGVVLVAQDGGEIVGVLGVSWQRAIRVPGRYGLIQELWVAPSHRRLQLGARLLEDLSALAREQGVGRLEVGLPGDRFAQRAATESFYARNAFEPVGLRMRRLL
ncbi:MAG TPA: GNAT family N-acetyltransferase [Solirubrobacteraceae bacterium]|nr:GNAT family N-acetyltransferase [Solirubrobacteraceae bacterium]